MPIDLSELLPGVNSTPDGVGFLFGAGTSLDAGYPTMAGLTVSVVGSLGSTHRTLMDEALGLAGVSYDAKAVTPNIEEIADIVTAHHLKSGDNRFLDLEQALRTSVLEAILSVSDPKLEQHCRFLEGLKKRTYGMAADVWVFTTNYDLLFERAAALVGVAIENGFVGAVDRYMDVRRLRTVLGEVKSSRFVREPALTVRLVKLHGSVSWHQNDGRVFERDPAGISTKDRVMILPRRVKAIETLAQPFESLFSLTRGVLGGDCKYVVSCGFSYSDDHINRHLLEPVLRDKKCRLFALNGTETVSLKSMRQYGGFQSAFANGCNRRGVEEREGTDLWKFSNFVNLF